MTNSTGAHEPGVYVKGSVHRVAETRAEAVALSFDGFRRKTSDAATIPEPETPSEPVGAPDSTVSGPDETGDHVPSVAVALRPAVAPRPPKKKD